MGIFVEIIQWQDASGQEIVHRFPENGTVDIKSGAQVIVEESQRAVFFKEGKAYDMMPPGRHTLTTQNIPILTRLLSLPFGFTSPFQCCVYYVNMKTFLNLKWGTKEPIVFRDAELKMVRLRAFGIYSIQIANPQVFMQEVVGSQGHTTTTAIQDMLRGVIIARLNDVLGESMKTIFDLPAVYDEMATQLKNRCKDDFAKYGIEMRDLLINAITPPDEVQKMIDERTGMAALGDMNTYMKFKAAKAIENASNNPGGLAGAGIGMGLGAGMGMAMPQMMRDAMNQPQAPQALPGGAAGQALPPGAVPQALPGPGAGTPCPKCQALVAAGAKFCSGCGNKVEAGPTCPQCQIVLAPGAKFCSGCGTKIEAAATNCPSCQAPLAAGAKFCAGCGHKIQ